MATESVAVPSNVIPFPARRSERLTWERRAREIIAAARVQEVRLASGESDEALLLLAARIGLEAVQRADSGDATPQLLCVGATGELVMVELAEDAAIPAGFEFAFLVLPDSSQGRIAFRLRETLTRARAAA